MQEHPVGVLDLFHIRGRRVEVAVVGRGAARAKDDVRADQPGEEHDFRGQKEPHGHLARRHGRVMVGRGMRDMAGRVG